MIAKLFDRVFQVNVTGQLTSNLTSKIEKAIHSSRFYNIRLIAVQVDSEGGSNVQAKQIVSALKHLSAKTLAPIYCFAGSQVLNSANIVLTAGNKVFATKYSNIGDFGFTQNITNMSQLIEQQNIKMVNLSQGEFKFRLNPFLPTQEQDVKWMLDLLHQNEYHLQKEILLNRQQKFKEGKITQEQIDQLFSGCRIKGEQAVKLRLVDHIESLDSLLARQYHGVKVIEAVKPKQYNLEAEVIDRLLARD